MEPSTWMNASKISLCFSGGVSVTVKWIRREFPGGRSTVSTTWPTVQAFEALAHVDGFHRDVDLRRQTQSKHGGRTSGAFRDPNQPHQFRIRKSPTAFDAPPVCQTECEGADPLPLHHFDPDQKV